MDDETENLSILKLTETDSRRGEDVVAKESPPIIIPNDRELLTLLHEPDAFRQRQKIERLHARLEDNR